MPHTPEHILLSRTDSIGDVMLTLPMAGLLKQRFPQALITFLGRTYTRPVLQRCAHVDHVITLEELSATNAPAMLRSLKVDSCIHVFPQRQVARWAKSAGIQVRIGTTNRLWHWYTCNERLAFSRKNSDLHEAQLNMKLLRPFGVEGIPALGTLPALYGFTPSAPPPVFNVWSDKQRRTVILHPGSRGSAVEWGLPNFAGLIELLVAGPFTVIVTGTEAEAENYRKSLPLHLPHVIDAGGSLTLDALIGVIGNSHALVAASTGPLHIAAACGIRAIGLYSSRRPIHPGRWAPVGIDAHALVFDPQCATCRSGGPCSCIQRIAPQRVYDLITTTKA